MTMEVRGIDCGVASAPAESPFRTSMDTSLVQLGNPGIAHSSHLGFGSVILVGSSKLDSAFTNKLNNLTI